MKLTRDQLLDAMQQSYDYYSARAVLSELLGELGLTKQTDFGAAEVGRLCDALSGHSRHAATIAALRAATGLGPAPDCEEPPADDAATKMAAAEKAAAEKAAAEKAAAEKAAAEKAAAEKAAAEKAAAEKAAAEKAAAEKAAEEKAAAEETVASDKATKGAKAAANVVTVTLAGVPDGAKAVRMVGDHALVGEWKAPQGFALSKKGAAWSGALEVDPGTAIEFKFVAETGDGEAWESGDNRKLTGAEGAQQLEASWQA